MRKLIAGPSVFVCDECVDLCNDIIREEMEVQTTEGETSLPIPVEIKDFLDDYNLCDLFHLSQHNLFLFFLLSPEIACCVKLHGVQF